MSGNDRGDRGSARQEFNDIDAQSSGRGEREDNTRDNGNRVEGSHGEPLGERDADGLPRRRRRGRRGGRRRSGGTRERLPEDQLPGDRDAASRGVPRSEGDGLPAPNRGDNNRSEEEPLPSGYGARKPALRPADTDRNRGESGRSESGVGRSSESRDRPRRRGRGDGSRSAGPRAAGAAGSSSRDGGDSSRNRGGRGRGRPTAERSSSSTGFPRGNRDDFAPVAGGYDEDDEGLDFLGIEDAAENNGSPRRENRHADDDDVLAESGLSSVLDVPSWVEAIGIVIAGNLDARSRSPRPDSGPPRDQHRSGR